jgi:ABC-type multidrug transport system ATPase subunit
MNETLLKVTNLRKNYKDVRAVDDISFEVKKGEIYGILGPNGSGKTTTLGILLGILKASGGSFSWFENGASDKNRLRIGAMLETPNFYPYMSAIDNLRIVARIRKIENEEEAIDRVLEIVDLSARAKSKFKTYSLGMKQRLAIAATLLSDPEILVFDEPTNGLDPLGIADIRTLIQNLANQGKTIILASHILDEMEKICTKVSIMRFGKILKTDSLKNIIGDRESIHVRSQEIEKIKAIVVSNNLTFKAQSAFEITVNGALISSADLNKLLAESGIYCDEIYIKKQSLETAFLDIIK